MSKNSNLLPHPVMNLSRYSRQSIGQPFIELRSVDSTNNYAMAQVHAGLAHHGTAYFAHEQRAGKGQRGKNWVSTEGESICISIVIEPTFLPLSRQFTLSALLALACHDLLSQYLAAEGLRIKWPNDLYWRDRKTGGILTETICRGNQWIYAIAGIGLNINQTVFPEDLPNPVSVRQVTRKVYPVLELAKELCQLLEKRYKQMEEQGPATLLKRYNELLYKRNLPVQLKENGRSFKAVVREINKEGQLVTGDNPERKFDFGEVEWLV
jgi:BirA family biotin operon repressor/biotin-[acetyl-CoA-carboxylase] ligase